MAYMTKKTSAVAIIILILKHDHSPMGLFRASAAQRDRPNACEGAPGSRQTVMNDPGAQQPS